MGDHLNNESERYELEYLPSNYNFLEFNSVL